ncbi:unnamed protein product [Dovyalis caffra]|uniref:RING-type E3 ubiquitin transferase n=1 Tax=Dovyalis caffra TaxID=77055 RepID=A0AAV1SJF3_9ROSI|nr:unnamed protein product [Dovyalis caffra]
MGSKEQVLKQELEELQKQLGKKQKFEDALSSLKSLLRRHYPSASPSLRKSFYSVVCRVATVLKTRHTAPGFWLAGLGLFQEAQLLTSDSTEKEHLKDCIAQAKEHLDQIENPPEVSQISQNRGYLFEGHLTVDPEPPRPQWLVRSNILDSILHEAESSGRPGDSNTIETAPNLLGELISNLDDMIPEIMEMGSTAPRVPPASKEVVAKLPVVTITEEILVELGKDAECAICKENLVVTDKMQELPCKHKFHPPCLKPWLDEHNSCPICRHELQTDDHAYESWKEREKEAAEERKGAENAVRGGEFIHLKKKKLQRMNYKSAIAKNLLISTYKKICRSCNTIVIRIHNLMELATSLHYTSPSNLIAYNNNNRYPTKTKVNPLFYPWIPTQRATISGSSSLSRMVSNGYAGRSSSSNFRYKDNNTVINNSNNKQRQKYTEMKSCLVIPPPKGRKPRAIIKFLGGAFIGAVPEVTYSCLIELLAKDGYVVILVPYNVTFDHSKAANQVYERFNACLDLLLQSGLPHVGLTASEFVGLPLFLLVTDEALAQYKLLQSNTYSGLHLFNASLQLGPLVNQMMPVVEASPMYLMARSASGDAWKVLLDTAGAIIPDTEQEALISLTKFVDQLPSVFGQVTEGISEFKPTPSENRDCCRNLYNVQHTLLVKFNFDAIDETDVLEETLKPRVESIGGTIEKVQLSGNHITPCIQSSPEPSATGSGILKIEVLDIQHKVYGRVHPFIRNKECKKILVSIYGLW